MSGKRTSFRPRRLAWLALVGSLVAASCARSGESEALVNVELAGDFGVEVYMVPLEDWDDAGTGLLDDPDGLERYFVGRTPKDDLSRRSGTYMVLWRCDGEWERDRVQLTAYRMNTVIASCR